MIKYYWTYILECADGSFYTGITNNLDHRIKQHNGNLKGGARYTRSRQPVIIRYFELYQSHKAAAKREYQLKQLSHKQKEDLCKSFILA